MTRTPIQIGRGVFVSGAVFALALSACGSHAVKSSSAVAGVGRGLSNHAHAVPQGAEACALQEALNAPSPTGTDKPLSDTCAKALNSDLLWRRSLIVLSAYSARLEGIAEGQPPESAGQVEAQLTGVRGQDWIDADAGQETAARDAVAKLVSQMTSKDKTDLDKTIKDAGPQVKAICDGLTSYLAAQATKFGDIRKDIEKKRSAKQDRRCATLDNRTFCVSESIVDRVVYAEAYAGLAMQEQNHLDAHDDVASFCAAHAKLESAAGSGDTGKDETYTGIVDAVKAVPRSQPPRGAAPSSSSSAAPASSGAPAATPEKK